MSSKLTSLILSALLAGLVVFTATAQSDGYDRYDQTYEKLGQYHLTINEIVNQHISALINFFDNEENLTITPEVQAVFLPPEDDELCFSEEPLNLSGHCLNQKIEEEFLMLRSSLAGEIQNLPLSLDQATRITSQDQEVEARDTFVVEQIVQSQQLREQTLEFYRQLLFAYPIHKQYELTIEELQEYRSNLRKLRNQINQYPSKFHDAATAYCV